MKKKTHKKMLGPTLQQFELVPVTDPAELAALDRRCRAAEKAMAAARKVGQAGIIQGVDATEPNEGLAPPQPRAAQGRDR